MARYILRLVATDEYLMQFNGDTYLKTTNKSNSATVYSESMLEEKRTSIARSAKKEYNSYIEVIRIL